jgi:hypothetical protein
MNKNQQASKKGKPRSAGKRKARIVHYYEMVYPLRKLRRIWKATGKVTALRAWADSYKTPTGVSGAAALVRFGKIYKIEV